MTDERVAPTIVQLIEKNSESVKQYKIEMPKNSILPGEVAKGMIYPLTAKDKNGAYLPALFVDISLVSKRQVYTILKDHNALLSPAVLNLQIPRNCDRLNPIRLEQSMYYYAFICAGPESESLMFYPILW